MDENTAWNCFKQSGNVRDYLIYAQVRQRSGKLREDRREDRDGRTGGNGEARG